ncbi:uncharacterized protein GIQ15_03096 [Arthroderma uncinatum]|uniref:uncharacterized protein n=1 Tax=Arthroderma uncinatum TaxID=74035 RepID=UPI00144A95A7|nr:uncharacterized protein GIQ15_03096 [Arthroderma uncinatum]KAF3483772.1 hypothetical protein GIQ15_03096 [Arthroderma uncinatum]
MDHTGQVTLTLNFNNAKGVKTWLETVPTNPNHAAKDDMPDLQDFTGPTTMDQYHHPDCDFQVRLIPNHPHSEDGQPSALDLYPTHWTVEYERSEACETEDTFRTAKSHVESDSIDWMAEEDFSASDNSVDISVSEESEYTSDTDFTLKETRVELFWKILAAAAQDKEEEKRKDEEEWKEEEWKDEEESRETSQPNALHTPFDINLQQASWFHKLDLSDEAGSINEEDREFLNNNPFEASSRQQIARQLRKLKPSWSQRQTKSEFIVPKLRQWKRALAARLG